MTEQTASIIDLMKDKSTFVINGDHFQGELQNIMYWIEKSTIQSPTLSVFARIVCCHSIRLYTYKFVRALPSCIKIFHFATQCVYNAACEISEVPIRGHVMGECPKTIIRRLAMDTVRGIPKSVFTLGMHPQA